ncbi:phosphotransferase-like protein [Paenibacillus gorillae]|uniref:phosphotransferase-like protein n=1 Tax=Paenibacillus gorillae TaxID=1243662 RepID=UPI00307B3AAA
MCRERNIQRGNRAEDQSEGQHKIMAENIAYDFKVNTHLNKSEECADLILQQLLGQHRG